MSSADQIQQDLDYVASAVRRQDRATGVPSIYFLWAGIVLVGFALPDFRPQYAGAFWFVAPRAIRTLPSGRSTSAPSKALTDQPVGSIGCTSYIM